MPFIVRKISSLFLATLLLSLFVCVSAAQTPLPSRFKKWLDEDARWIITDQERARFLDLSTDDQRDKFIADFWERRNPTPGSPENSFKAEHYRRIAYATSHFTFNDKKGKETPGWKSDRGRIYILYGTPDSIDKHGGGGYQLASGVKAVTDPFELWYYKSIPRLGQDITVKFVDKCRCGDYQQSGEMEEGQVPSAPE
ncbi:MAG TPA: GWxTD domain-containing protein [Terriglobales bacterium]|nr:GWxTD domain-containing protein [Terriglobales bacterium]